MVSPFVSSASASEMSPAPGLSDEAMGQLARATLEDLAKQSTYEGKLLTLVRTLRHLEDASRDETLRRTQRKGEWGPGWDECAAIYEAGRQEQPKASRKTRSSIDPRELLLPERVEQYRLLMTDKLGRLFEQSPGPLSARLRRTAFITGTAHMACQWGCFEAAEQPLRWCGATIQLLRSHWDLHDENKLHRLDILSVMSSIGSIAAKERYVALVAGISRRLTSELAAMARAAARLEGLPEADPEFIGRPDVVESITGMDQETATASLGDFSRALEATLAGVVQTPPAVRRISSAPRAT